MRALIIVDVQNDFVPGGALAVPEGDRIIPIINQLISHFDHVVATRDWHPPDHGSFAPLHGKQPGEIIDLHGLPQILWPVHCVRNTPGAEFVTTLDTSRIHHIVHKGTDPHIDSYSAFFDNGHRKSTGLADHLRQKNITDLYLTGLATDVCVKFTALDARQLGFNTYLIEDATRGVELKPGDVAAAIEDMKRAGVHVIHSTDILSHPQP